MKTFSNFITEARKQYTSSDLTKKDITDYIEAVKKDLPINVQKLLYLTSKYDLTNAEQLDKIRDVSKGQLKNLVDELDIPMNVLEEIWHMFKDIKQQYRLMPQYMTNRERESIMKKKLRFDDLTIDLETTAGKNAVARMYTPMVIKIANQFVGKSKLDKSDLMSAGMEGLMLAMQDWSPEGMDDKDPVPFKTYAAYRIRQKINNEIDINGHDLSGTSWYSFKMGSKADAISMDAFDGDDKAAADHLAALGDEDINKNYDIEDPAWKKLYQMLEKNFSHRDVDIFYRYLGLNGRKREKAGDIAKEYGISQSSINNGVFKKILKYLQTNKKALDILDELKDLYLEGLLKDSIPRGSEYINELLYTDDIYLMFEEVTRWSNKYNFLSAYKHAYEQTLKTNRKDIKVLEEVMNGDYVVADDNIKTHKILYINFLKHMYPTESFDKITDVTLLERMVEIQEAYKKFKK